MINLQCNLGVVVCILFCTSTNHFNIRKRCSAFYILRGTCIFLFDNEELKGLKSCKFCSFLCEFENEYIKCILFCEIFTIFNKYKIEKR